MPTQSRFDDLDLREEPGALRMLHGALERP
jgi:hypothetical protein